MVVVGQLAGSVDLVLVDPYEYQQAHCVLYAEGTARVDNSTGNSLLLATAQKGTGSGYCSGGRRMQPGTTLQLQQHASASSSSSSSPQSALKMGGSELAVIDHCRSCIDSTRIAGAAGSARSASSAGSAAGRSSGVKRGGVNGAAASPTVVSTDWLWHCLALGRVVDHRCLDLFSVPADPERRPCAFKSVPLLPPEQGGRAERYSKGDVVYFASAAAGEQGQGLGTGMGEDSVLLTASRRGTALRATHAPRSPLPGLLPGAAGTAAGHGSRA